MNSFDRSFDRLFLDKLKELRERLTEDLIHGIATFDQYNRQIGAIQNMDQIKAICEDVRSALSHD